MAEPPVAAAASVRPAGGATPPREAQELLRPGPGDLKACRRAAEWALAAGTALELGLFDRLGAGPAPAAEMARTLSLSPRGVDTLLGVLEELGLVRREGDAWTLTGQGRARFVDRDTPDHEAAAVRHWLANIRRWAADLPEAVRVGSPPGERGRPGEAWEDEEALGRFMAAMASKAPELVRRVVDHTLARLEGRSPGSPLRVLDLGGGPGTFSRAFADRGARVVLADTPEVIEFVADEYGLGSHPGIELWEGDFLEDLPDGAFDAVLLANITHIYAPDTNRSLIRRVATRIRPRGVLSILDFVRGPSEFAALFAVTMLLVTEAGGTYGRDAYEEWLAAAGLEDPRLVPLDPERQLITARRSAGG